MKYSDFISLQEYFHPVFNLQDEAEGYWKQFIPNMQFNNMLQTVIESVRTADPKKRKSIWIQGTFGTGKSHAGSVVKHLLCDPVADTSDYIQQHLVYYTQLTSSLNALRKNKTFLPIVLKGSEGIYNSRTFTLKLEKAVKATLAEKGITVAVPSQFERYISHIETKHAINWDEIIANDEYLSSTVASKNDILKKLHSNDVDFMGELEDALNKQDIDVLSSDEKSLSKWLTEVTSELQKTKKADGIIIFWDEFTSIMDSISSGLTNQLQNIAELSEKNEIFLYLISHRTPAMYNDKSDDITKMKDRFHIIQYGMEVMTTYHIMAATIKKLDTAIYEKESKQSASKLDSLIKRLISNDSSQAASDITKLYPMHPYTAYLSTFVARNIGSANRSVFNFLYDDEKGFASFINSDSYEKKELLTADKLWDFFYDSFDSDQAKYGIILERYLNHQRVVNEQGEGYLRVFEGILLLNAMTNILSRNDEDAQQNVLPTATNIKALFEGEAIENQVDTILDFIDKNQIVNKDPMGNFIIEFSALPATEIAEQVRKQQGIYSKALEVLHYSSKKESELLNTLSSTLHAAEVEIFECGEFSEDALRGRLLTKTYKTKYSLHIAAFVAKEEADKLQAQVTIKKLASDISCQNIIFVLVGEVLGTERHSKFIDYVARAQVAAKHQLTDQVKSHNDNADKIVAEWVSKMKSNLVSVFFRSSEPAQDVLQTTYRYINNQIAPVIFSSGIDSSKVLRGMKENLWKVATSKKVAEVFLLGLNRDDAEDRLNGERVSVKAILKDDNDQYIVDTDLVIKDNADDNNLLVKVQHKVDSLLESVQQRVSATFNIAAELEPLIEPTFGVYPNVLNYALMGCVMRKYINVLYHADLGQPMTGDNIRDLIDNMFGYWTSDSKGLSKLEPKVKVRFGSKEEKQLKDAIVNIFNLSSLGDESALSSLTSVKFLMNGKYINKFAKYPLWGLLYADIEEKYKEKFRLLFRIISSAESKMDDIARALKAIKDDAFKLSLIASKQENYASGFKNFILSLEEGKSAIDKFDEFLSFLTANLQGERAEWTEDNVEKNLLRWVLRQSAASKQPTNNTTSYSSVENDDDDTPSVVSEGPSNTPWDNGQSKAEVIKGRILTSQKDTTALKYILMTIADECPNALDIIDKQI